MADSGTATQPLPIIIIGAGISGLLLAQQLRKSQTPYKVFERDSNWTSRGIGWGLTLQWSLPALRELLPQELVAQLRDTYVDRAAVERGELSTFPYFDLSTGEKKYSSPTAGENQRIRVTREKLRRLLATNIDIQWGRSFASFREDEEIVEAIFEDGTICRGRLVIGCDGVHSMVRRAVYPSAFATHDLPVTMCGFTLLATAEQAEPIRRLDPYFLQGTASSTDIFMYLSLLDAPQDPKSSHNFVYQICISWKWENPTPEIKELLQGFTARADGAKFIKSIATQWAEPFKSFLSLIADTTDVKLLHLEDLVPRTGLRQTSKVILLGDAFHAMSMYRGEGANHTIVDVLDLSHKLLPHLDSPKESLHTAIDGLEEAIMTRTRPAVLASRQACLDAHDSQALIPTSPLLTRRQMYINFDE